MLIWQGATTRLRTNRSIGSSATPEFTLWLSGCGTNAVAGTIPSRVRVRVWAGVGLGLGSGSGVGAGVDAGGCQCLFAGLRGTSSPNPGQRDGGGCADPMNQSQNVMAPATLDVPSHCGAPSLRFYLLRVPAGIKPL